MKNDLFDKIKILMFTRVIIVSLILGTVILYQIKIGQPAYIPPISFIVSFIYFISIAYALSLRYFQNLEPFAYTQLLVDIFLEAIIVYVTGGLNSPLIFLYVLSIMSGSIILRVPVGYVLASAASIIYGLMANLELYGLIVPINVFEIYTRPLHGEVLYKVSTNIAAFYIIAFLTSYLAENLRKTGVALEAKSVDLRKLKKFHENVVATMGGGLVAYDIKGNIVSFNRAAENITGYKYEDIAGLSVDTIFKESGLKEIIERMRLESLQGTVRREERWEGFVKGRDGRVAFLSVTLSVLEEEKGYPIGFICLFQDLTSMKDMESRIERSERLSALGRIVAEVAHEIRNPLASISGSIQLLKGKLLFDGGDKKLMDIIVRETDSLNNIITGFIRHAAPAKASLARCDLNIVIEDTVFLLKNSAKMPDGLEIEVSLSDKPLPVMGDSEMLKQVMWNLSINALEAIPPDRVGYITIKSSPLYPKRVGDPSGKAVKGEIVIEDNGGGITEENLPKIFNPLFSTKDMGTGLGLVAVHRIVEEHGGTIGVDSREGEGTKFILRLPLLTEDRAS